MSEKITIDLVVGKQGCHFFLAIVDQILFIFAGNDDIHKSLDMFEIRPDQITDHRVSSSWASKKSMLKSGEHLQDH